MESYNLNNYVTMSPTTFMLLHSGGGHVRREMPARPASVMNIYGSTGDLYQHLRPPPVRPLATPVRQPVGPVAVGPGHPLERTASVSSALDGGAIYGTIRRPASQLGVAYHQQAPGDSASPTRDYPQPQQQQHPAQIPLRMTLSTPGGYPVPNAVAVRAQMAYDYQQMARQAHAHHQYVYATLPAKRQSPYGVPGVVSAAHASQYRQVLPPMAGQVALRPAAGPFEARLAGPPAMKDERGAPEGASSSPSLAHHDVTM